MEASFHDFEDYLRHDEEDVVMYNDDDDNNNDNNNDFHVTNNNYNHDDEWRSDHEEEEPLIRCKEKFMPSQPQVVGAALTRSGRKRRYSESSVLLESTKKRARVGIDNKVADLAPVGFRFRRSKIMRRSSQEMEASRNDSSRCESDIDDKNHESDDHFRSAPDNPFPSSSHPTAPVSVTNAGNGFSDDENDFSLDSLADFPTNQFSASTPFHPKTASTVANAAMGPGMVESGVTHAKRPTGASVAQTILNKGGKKTWKKPPPSPFTPKPRYTQMATPELKQHLAKYGVRQNLKKKQLVKVAEDIFDKMHQYETDSEYEKTVVESPSGSRSLPPRLTGLPVRRSMSQPVFAAAGSSSSDEEEDEEEGGAPLECLEESCFFDEQQVATATQASKKDALKAKIRAVLLGDKDLHQRVLFYTPLDFEQFHGCVRKSGIICNKQFTMAWLDDMGIQFSMKNTKEGERRKEQTVKRQERWKKKNKTQK